MNRLIVHAALMAALGSAGAAFSGAPRIRGVHRVPAESEAGRRFVTALGPSNQTTGHAERPGCKAAQRRLRQLDRAKAKHKA